MVLFDIITLEIYLLAAVFIVFGAIGQSTIGIGFGMFAAPFLAFIEPRLVPGTVLIMGMTVSTMIVIREFRHIDRAGLSWALVGRAVGAVAAGMTIALIPTKLFGILFALLILLAVALSMLGWRLLPTRNNLITAGVLSGYMGTITSVGAPPVALVYQHRSAEVIRPTMATFLFIGAGMSIVTLAITGRFGTTEFLLGLLMLPPLLFGFFLSRFILPFVDRGFVRPLILSVTALAALALLIRSLLV